MTVTDILRFRNIIMWSGLGGYETHMERTLEQHIKLLLVAASKAGSPKRMPNGK